jgi:hypothetical protein
LALTPGTRLGPYEILSALGAVGMGEVYKARDTPISRTVAIKMSTLPARMRGTRQGGVSIDASGGAVVARRWVCEFGPVVEAAPADGGQP